MVGTDFGSKDGGNLVRLSPSIRGNRWRISLEPILGDEDHQWGPAN